MSTTQLWQHPYVNVVKLHQKDNLKYKTQGDVQQTMNNEIGKNVFQIRGQIPAANFMSFPDVIGKSSVDQKMALTGNYVYVQFRVNPREFFVFHIELLTKDDQPLRMSFSNIYKEFKVSPPECDHSQTIFAELTLTICQKTQKSLFFTTPFLTDKWTILAIDVKEIIHEHFNKVFKSIRGFMFCANMIFKNVFTSPNIYNVHDMPRDMFLPVRGDDVWNDLYDWIWFPGQPNRIELAQIIAPKTLPKPYDSPSFSFRKNRSRNDSRNTSISSASSNSPQRLYPNPIMSCSKLMGYTGIYASNLLWTSDGKHIIYTCYSTIIKMHIETGEQTYFFGHTENVACIAIDAKSNILVSAQAGKLPLVRVWEISTTKCLSIVKAHEQDVSCIAISDNGNMLTAVGKDKVAKVLIVLWDISKAAESGHSPIVTKYSCDYPVSVIKFVPAQESKLVTCGLESIRFWRVKGGVFRGCSVSNENFNLIKQQFTDICFEKTFLNSGAQDQRRVYFSTTSGSIFEVNYEQRLVECVYQLHNGPINSIFVNEGMCVTGSEDNFIRVWPLDFTDYFLEAEHDSGVRSVSISVDGLNICIGTASGSIGILNLSTQNYQTQIRSHTDTITSVAVDHQRPEFATISKDQTIRVWDASTHKQLYQFDTEGEIPTSITYHPCDYAIACGFNSGIIRVFDVAAASVIEEYKPHAKVVQDLVYSRDCKWLVSICEETICVSDAFHRYQPVKLISFMHPCLRACLSLSLDGKYLASIGPSGNVVHLFNTTTFDETHIFETASSDTFSSIQFAPNSREIVAATSDLRIVRINIESGAVISEIPNIHFSPVIDIEVSKNGKYIVTAGTDKIIKVWDYNTAAFQAFIGHSKQINKVCFTCDTKSIVSVSEESIIIWTFNGDTSPDLSLLIDNHLEKKQLEDSQESSIDMEPGASYANLLSRSVFPQRTLSDRLFNLPSRPVLSLSDSEVSTSAVETTATTNNDITKVYQPNHISAQPPTEFLLAPPDNSVMSIERIVGYNGNAHDNVHWDSKYGILFYTCNNNIIIEDLETQKQKLLIGHEEDISCMDFNPKYRLIASASGIKEHRRSPIIVWNCDSGKEIQRLEYHTDGVQTMHISPDGKYIASTGIDDENVLVISSIETAKIVATGKAQSRILSLSWFPSSPRELITTGEDAVILWFFDLDRNVLMMKESNIQPALIRSDLEHSTINYTSLAFHTDEKSVWVGSDKGFIIAINLESASLQQIWLDVHKEEIDAICWRDDNIITSGSDCSLKRWRAYKKETEISPIYSFEHREQMDLDGKIVAMQFHADGSEGVVSTSGNTIWYVNWKQKQCIRLVSGHLGCVNSIAAIPGNIVSASSDRTVRFWSQQPESFEQTLQVQTANESAEPTCLVIGTYYDKQYCAVGYSDGQLQIIRLDAINRLTKGLIRNKVKLHPEPVSCISICGKRIFCGGANGSVTLIHFNGQSPPYEENAECTVHRLIQLHGQRICSIDSIQTKTKEFRYVISTTVGEISVWKLNRSNDNMYIHRFAPPEYSSAVAEREKFVIDLLVRFCPKDTDSILYTGPFSDDIGPSIVFYDFKRKKKIRSSELQRFARCIDVADLCDYIAFGTTDRLVAIMDYEDGTMQEYLAHGDSVTSVLFYQNSETRHLLSGGFSDIVLWRFNEN